MLKRCSESAFKFTAYSIFNGCKIKVSVREVILTDRIRGTYKTKVKQHVIESIKVKHSNLCEKSTTDKIDYEIIYLPLASKSSKDSW